MRLVLVAALCLACAAKNPPREGSLRAGMQLARTNNEIEAGALARDRADGTQ